MILFEVKKVIIDLFCSLEMLKQLLIDEDLARFDQVLRDYQFLRRRKCER